MTLEEIARALGAKTTEEIAAECGFVGEVEVQIVRDAVERQMVRPTLVLDYRGGEEPGPGGRWARMAKGPLADKPAAPLRLDPRTGLHWDGKKTKAVRKGRAKK